MDGEPSRSHRPSRAWLPNPRKRRETKKLNPQSGLSRGILDVFCPCPMVRLPVVQSTVRNQNQRRTAMTQKIIEVVGTSKESFAKAAENAVAEAAKTVRGLRWARVAELEMELDGKKIAQYRATTKIYFDIEK